MFIKVLFPIFVYIFMFFTTLNAQNSVSDFLHSARKHFEQILSDENLQNVHIVMGNESADLDSIISSISYAYLLSYESNEAKLYFPLINIKREEIALRKDILYLFQLYGVAVEDLLFLDDNILLDELFEKNRLRLTLVDHNILNPKQKHLSDAVERIVDHHVDEDNDYPLVSYDQKLITVVGSNATLIAEKMFSSEKMIMNPELAGLLLAPVLIDTSNLSSIEKTTLRDIEVVKKLQEIAVIPLEYYEKLIACKRDIEGFTAAMLLSKDFKEYVDGDISYGISVLPPVISWDIENLDQVGNDIQKYASDRHLNYFILLMSSNEPHSKRKILVYSRSLEMLRVFDSYVQADEKLKNILIPLSYSESYQVQVYKTEKGIARKQLQPLFDFSKMAVH